ncbi:hypothetical protein ACJZRZ_003871 [Vibrio parahaemolyticus]|nr:hypothetical protein [Vibrio parahaemolyticus]EIA1769526.1 hypothetical protein [Vibrio parahaemolyticus]HBC3831398.1 hypothetical protein [Vibrio parahaemolyticus]
MLAFLKKWRKAYLEDKGDRLHAQVEAERNVLCQQANTPLNYKRHMGAFLSASAKATEETLEEWRY